MIAHFTGAATLLALDLMWLRFYMGQRYNVMVSDIQNRDMTVSYSAALIAYLFMVYGLLHFVLTPLLAQKPPQCDYTVLMWNAIVQGFPFGATLYGVYNGTSSAVFSGWDSSIAITDTLWGGALYTVAGFVSLVASCHTR